MAEPYRSSVTKAELERAERPTGLMAHLLHAIAPPRTNKGYDATKGAGEGNLPYAEPGFFRRLAGDPGRTWNQLAQQDVTDLGTTRALAGEEHDRTSQLADKDINARSGFLDRELQGAKEREIMRNASRVLENFQTGILGMEGQRRSDDRALERTEVLSRRYADNPAQSRLYNANARTAELANEEEEKYQRGELTPPVSNPGWFQRLGQGIKSIFGGGGNSAPPGTPDGSNVDEPSSPPLIPGEATNASARMPVSRSGMGPDFPWMADSVITGVRKGATALSPHLGVGRATASKKKPLWKGNALPGLGPKEPTDYVTRR